MVKEFNVTGTCIPEKHFMVDITSKIKKIIELINKGKYFTINRPRQYGKTTTLYMLSRTLKKREGYLVIRISFESIDIPTYKNQESFIQVFLDLLQQNIEIQGLDYLSEIICNESKNINNMRELSKLITKIVIAASKKVILIIDEVDKSSNNQLFLDLLGMLRSKYLMANEGEDYTFHSVILAGVHDIKNLKLKIRNGEEKNYNSSWNIAEDFRVNLSFVVEDIATMLKEYCFEYKVNMNIESIAEKLYFYTSGYPFLVSKLCKIIDEIIIEDEKKEWAVSYVDEAVKILLKEDNTNFQSLIKNLENNKELYNFIKRIVIDGQNISYVITDNIISQGTIYGIFKDEKGICKIQNRIYEQLIYNHMTMKILREEKVQSLSNYNFRENFINEDGSLNFERVLLKFQEFMKKEYTNRDVKFLEQNGRLIFLAFIKPIINGIGFDFKEVQISEEKRLDVVITYLNKQYIIEMKIWRGQKVHEKGLSQLSNYLDIMSKDKGYLLIFNFNKESENKWKKDSVLVDGKEIFTVWV